MTRQRIRNIGILAHIDAGKTTLTESLLHSTGAVRYPGSVDAGSTSTDWLVQEQERGITIGSAAITCRWRDVDITIVDTPGHVDFTLEVERSLRVLDGAVLVISGPDGVQAQTETVWHQGAQHGLPVVAFVNKLDRPGFDDEILQEDIRRRLGIEPVPLFIPILADGAIGLVDVLGGQVFVFPLDGLVRRQWSEPQVREPTEDEELERLLALERIVDAVASYDDAFAEAVLRGETPDLDAFVAALRQAVLARACLPLLYGVARFGVGVAMLSDAIVALLPSPEEVPPPQIYNVRTGEGEVVSSDAMPTAFVFKTEPRQSRRRLAFVRVFSGSIARGDTVLRLPGEHPVTATEIVQLMGGDDEPIDVLTAGMIGAIAVEDEKTLPQTGDTLTPGAATHSYERFTAPAPVLSITIEADDLAAHEAMLTSVRQLCLDDPSLVLGVDRSSGHTSLSGMGELHLVLAIERVERETKVEIRTGSPTARLRQVIAHEAQGEGASQHGRAAVEIVLTVRPVAQAMLEVPVSYLRAPPKRHEWHEALITGVAAATGTDGFGLHSVVGVEVVVDEIRVHGSDLPPVAFRNAADLATSHALSAAGIADAEPWVAVTIVVPEVAVGRIVGDLMRRRGRIRGSQSRGDGQVLTCEAPLGEMIGYATELRSMTGGRGVFSMEPMGYEPVTQ
ncbi:MAG: elongation factor G [Myxococcota bacterium]|jgi:elongation factor G